MPQEIIVMAEEQGLSHAYSMAALKAFFQQEHDIGDLEVLDALADPAALKRFLIERG